MNKQLLFSAIYLFSVFLSSVSQILLKKSASSQHKSRVGEYLDPRVILAYAIFLGATLVTVLALRYVPLSQGAIFESTGYVYVGILSVLFLHERLSPKKIAGMLCILVGAIIFSL